MADDIRSEMLAPPTDRKPFVTPIPSRPGWSIELRVHLSEMDKAFIAKAGKRFEVESRGGKADERAILEADAQLSSSVVALLTVRMLRGGETVPVAALVDGGGDAALTFRHQAMLGLYGVKTASAACRRFVGDEALSALMAEWEDARKVWGTEGLELDPRP